MPLGTGSCRRSACLPASQMARRRAAEPADYYRVDTFEGHPGRQVDFIFGGFVMP